MIRSSWRRWLFIAIVAILLPASALAQLRPTTLGRWVQDQPPSVQRRIRCDVRPPYSTLCSETLVSGRKRWYSQDEDRILMWTESNR
jgi:hypothetical protein